MVQKEYLIIGVMLVLGMMVLPVYAYTVNNTITNMGSTVFLGEEGLDLTEIVKPGSNALTYGIGWWGSGADIYGSTPQGSYTFSPSNINAVSISQSAFGSYLGNWYIKTASGFADGNVIFNVQEPYLTVDIVDLSQTPPQTVNGVSVVQGSILGFKIGTNMGSAVNNPSKRSGGTSGWADIKIRTNIGGTYTALSNGTFSNGTDYNTLLGQKIDSSMWTWGDKTGGWNTGALKNGQLLYPNGPYTITVESQLNNMKNNYKNSAGADYVGKTVSAVKSVTIASDSLEIIPNMDTVAQSKSFSVTINGKPNQVYHVWVKGTNGMDGGANNQPPQIAPNQLGVTQDINGTTYEETRAKALLDNQSALGYVYQNSGTKLVMDSVSATEYTDWGSSCAANVKLSEYGSRVVGFTTNNWTKPQKYTIHVEQNFNGQYMYDEADITVTKGNVFITATGDQNYYLGEEIKLSGTNSVSYQTYLFITGPNLNTYGAQINNANPRTAPVTGHEDELQSVSVDGDNTWEWTWGTGGIALDTGTYTIWAISQRSDASPSNLASSSYGTISINLKKPFIYAVTSGTNVAKGDTIKINGKAEGNPTSGVQIWILGKNYFAVNTQSVDNDASFSYEIPASTTNSMYPGQYFVVIQHPMQNGIFDIDYDLTNGTVFNKQLGNGMNIFKLTGSGSLQGSDAAEALIQGINDANIDDMYTKFQFTVENPYIEINPIPYKQIGDKFQIIATTNLATGDIIMVEVYSSSFKPTQKSSNGEFSGATGSVGVTKGADGSSNRIIFDVDTSTFKSDEYAVTETAIIQSVVGTSVFNVGTTPPKPTTTITVTNATATNTTNVTQTPIPIYTTKIATNTTTTAESPGFSAIFALIGLIIVGLVICVKRQ
jgi:hypothetical protein